MRPVPPLQRKFNSLNNVLYLWALQFLQVLATDNKPLQKRGVDGRKQFKFVKGSKPSHQALVDAASACLTMCETEMPKEILGLQNRITKCFAASAGTATSEQRLNMLERFRPDIENLNHQIKTICNIDGCVGTSAQDTFLNFEIEAQHCTLNQWITTNIKEKYKVSALALIEVISRTFSAAVVDDDLAKRYTAARKALHKQYCSLVETFNTCLNDDSLRAHDAEHADHLELPKESHSSEATTITPQAINLVNGLINEITTKIDHKSAAKMGILHKLQTKITGDMRRLIQQQADIDHSSRVSILEEKLKLRHAELELAASEYHRLQQENHAIRDHILETHEAHTAETKELAEKLSDAQAKLAKAVERYQDLSNEFSAAQVKYSAESTSHTAELETKQSAFEAEHSMRLQAEAERDAAAAKLSQATDAITASRTRVDSLLRELAEQHKANATLDSSLAQLTATHHTKTARYDDEMRERDTLVESLREEATRSKQATSDLRATLSEERASHTATFDAEVVARHSAEAERDAAVTALARTTDAMAHEAEHHADEMRTLEAQHIQQTTALRHLIQERSSAFERKLSEQDALIRIQQLSIERLKRQLDGATPHVTATPTLATTAASVPTTARPPATSAAAATPAMRTRPSTWLSGLATMPSAAATAASAPAAASVAPQLPSASDLKAGRAALPEVTDLNLQEPWQRSLYQQLKTYYIKRARNTSNYIGRVVCGSRHRDIKLSATYKLLQIITGVTPTPTLSDAEASAVLQHHTFNWRYGLAWHFHQGLEGITGETNVNTQLVSDATALNWIRNNAPVAYTPPGPH